MPQLPLGDIGPCEVTWDYGGASPIVITPHLGKVTISMADATADVHGDLHGESQGDGLLESFFEGTTVELAVPMARSTLSQLANTIGYDGMGLLVGNVLTLYNIAGVEMYAQAKMMVIKPMCDETPDPDPHHWIVLYKCHPYRDFELGYDRAGQRVHMVKFKVFANQDSGYEGEYFQEGLISWREDFYDDFCDATLEAGWTTHGTSVDKTITIDPATCILTIEIANNANAVWFCTINNIAPKIHRPLGMVPPCRITTKLAAIPPDPGATCPDDIMAGMFIGTDPEGLGGAASHLAFLWGRYRSAAEGADCLRLRRNCGAYDPYLGCGGGCLPKWLRIDIDASEDIRFYYSDDGAAWTQYESGGGPLVLSGEYAVGMKVGIYAQNGIWDPVGGPYANLAAQFEYFEIESYG